MAGMEEKEERAVTEGSITSVEGSTRRLNDGHAAERAEVGKEGNKSTEG